MVGEWKYLENCTDPEWSGDFPFNNSVQDIIF